MPSRPSATTTSSGAPTVTTQRATVKPYASSNTTPVTTRRGANRIAKPVAVRDTRARPTTVEAPKPVKQVKQVKAVKTVLPRSTTAAAASHGTRSIKSVEQLRKTANALPSYDINDPYAVPVSGKPSARPTFDHRSSYAGPYSPVPENGRRGSA